jgi:iron complex outermembrane receptor protein
MKEEECTGDISIGRVPAIILLIALQTISVLSQSNGKRIAGIVLDGETNRPISEVVVSISELELFTTTDSSGQFYFNSVIEGIYSLQFTHLSFKENIISVNSSIAENNSLIVYLLPKTIEFNPVIVTDVHTHSKFDELNEFSNVLKGSELQKQVGLTLAASLKNETGLAIRSMGPAPARPVVRGLGGDRVHISEDGVKTTDLSATSPDHAVTIEPFSLERIEVIRGPKVLLFTPVTIGGVVNAIRHEIPYEKHSRIFSTIGLYGETVNKGYLGSITSQVPINDLIVRIEASRRKTDDLMTPIGQLDNSNSSNLTYSLGGSYFFNNGLIGASYRNFDLDYGVPGGFVGAHPFGVNIEMKKQQYNIKSKIDINSASLNSIEIQLSRSYYRHKEFEFGGLIGSEFKIINYNGKAILNHKRLAFFESGSWGTSFEYRDYVVGGYVFNPPSTSYNISLFAFERLKLNKFNVEFSLRYAYDNIMPEYDNPNSNIGYIRPRSFHNYSLSISLLYPLTDIVFVGANISKSSRVPTIEELYSEGPHLAAYSFETGNPDLNSESGIGTEFFVYHKFESLFFNLNLFYNNLNYYIIPRNTGEFNFQTLLPIYATIGVPAVLYGTEFQLDWNIYDHFSMLTSMSYTIGNFKNTNQPLPQIPPLKGLVELKYTNNVITFGLNLEAANSQERTDEFEESTAGYVIFNGYVQSVLEQGDLIHSISLSAENIFNKEYRNHLSRVKSIMPEAGRNFKLTYKLFFEI